MAERTGSPIDAARPTTSIGRDFPQVQDMYSSHGAKGIVIREATPDIFATETEFVVKQLMAVRDRSRSEARVA